MRPQFPHFFGILSDLEMQNLKYSTISAAIFAERSWDPAEFSGPVRRVVQKMTGLQYLMIVYTLSELMSLAWIHEEMDKEMEFLEELPPEGPGIAVRELPNEEEWSGLGFDGWEVRRMRPVYGWRVSGVSLLRGRGGLPEKDWVGSAGRDGTWDVVWTLRWKGWY